ncbi:AMP-binding protein [Streptomyces sp. NPDC059008]|uniref:AMP-binding protein n=1 Tax=Streptomyces sp. NPDC059008 TaxID=3346693 RepID=UPI00367E6A24
MTNPLIKALLARGQGELMLIAAAEKRRVLVGGFLDGVKRCAGALRLCGVGPGDRVAVTMRADARFMTVVYACLFLGAVPALFDPGLPSDVVGRGMGRLRVRLWLTENADEAGSVAATELLDGPPLPAPAVVEPSHPCLIIHTSGTTGAPKPVVWSCALVASYLDQQRILYGAHRLVTEFVVLPFLGLMDAALGRALILPQMGDAQPGRADIAAAHRQMTDLGCDYTFASLTFWRRMVDYCAEHRLAMPAVGIATTSGAPSSARVVENLVQALPTAHIDVHYASTEAPIPLAVMEARDLATRAGVAARHGLGVPVGMAQDARIAVLPLHTNAPGEFDDADLLPPGQIGEIIVTGPRVSSEYAELPEVTSQAKLRDPGGSLWHRMGDIGYLDDDGMLWFLCRRKHLISTAQGTLYPDQQEFTYNHQFGLSQCALICPPGGGELYLVVPDAEYQRAPADQIHALARHLAWPTPQPVAFPGWLPVDRRHSVKIDRPALAVWLTQRVITVPEVPGSKTDGHC